MRSAFFIPSFSILVYVQASACRTAIILQYVQRSILMFIYCYSVERSPFSRDLWTPMRERTYFLGNFENQPACFDFLIVRALCIVHYGASGGYRGNKL